MNFIPAVNPKPTHTTDENGGTSVTLNPGDIVEVENNDAGGGSAGHWYQYLGGTQTNVNLTTTNFFNTSLWTDLGANPIYRLKNYSQTYTTYLDNSFGLDNNLFDTWSQATSNNSNANIALAGSLTIETLDQNSNASINQEAQINQSTDPTYRTGTQNVFVLATGTNSSMNAGGSVQTPGLSGSSKELQVGVNGPDYGVQASDASIGAAFVIVNYSDNVTATIATGVNLYADSLDVDAETAVFNFSTLISGGSSKKFGFIGVMSLVNVSDTTHAQVAAGSSLTVGNSNVVETFPVPKVPPAFTTAAIQSNALPGTSGTDASGNPTNTVAASTIVQAHDWFDQFNFAGGIMSAGNAGVGAAVGVGTISRDTQSFVGDPTGSSGGSMAHVISGGKVIVNAKNNGLVLAAALAGAKQSSDASSGSGSYGVGVSGDVAYNQVTDTTEAYVHNANITAAGLNVNATNATNFIAISGSGAIVLNTSGTSVGIAGSYTQNSLGGTTTAFLDNAALNLSSDLLLDAATQGQFYSLSASGSFVPGGTAIAIAGQVSVNNMTMATLAKVADHSSITAGANKVTLASVNDNGIFSIAGALSYGDKAGIGAALATNTINATAGAYFEGSSVPSAGGVNLSATNSKSQLLTITAGGAGSQTFALGGAVSLNQVANTNDAHISGGSKITSSGALAVVTSDNPLIEALSGGLAGSGTAAVGAALATNNIDDNTRSYIDGSNVTAASVALTATSTANIESLTAAGTGAATFALGGAIGLNSISDITSAYIADNSVVDATGAISLTATDDPSITSGAGALGAAGTAAIAAGVATNNISDSVTTYVDSASQLQAGSVALNATETATIEAASLGVSASGTVAVTGGVGVNHINNTTDAHIAGNSTVTAMNNVAIAATDSSNAFVAHRPRGRFAGRHWRRGLVQRRWRSRAGVRDGVEHCFYARRGHGRCLAHGGHQYDHGRLERRFRRHRRHGGRELARLGCDSLHRGIDSVVIHAGARQLE